MPKESTHIFLAEKAFQLIKNDGRFESVRKYVQPYPHLFYLGSAAPDSVYNYIKGPAKQFLRKNTEHSHGGCGNDLFGYFRRFAEYELPPAPALSFGLGILSHLTADMVFHPMVYHFCGKDTAGIINLEIIRHYRFESMMDRTLRYLFPEIKKESLKKHLKHKEMRDIHFNKALESLHVPEDHKGIVPLKEFSSMYKTARPFRQLLRKEILRETCRTA